MASGLNSRNPLVNILDDEHYEAKMLRFKFIKYVFISGVLNAVIASALFAVMGSYIRAGVHFFVTILAFWLLMVNTIKRLNLKSISGIIFDNAEYTSYANNEIVFDAMRHICEMKGIVRGRKDMILLFHIFTVVSLIVELVSRLVGGLIVL